MYISPLAIEHSDPHSLSHSRISPLPVELIETIIDLAAECCPQSLPACSLVSRQWNARSTYQLHRVFRRPTLCTFDAVLAFVNIVKEHHRLAALAETLKVVPNLELNAPFSSYVPFHHLSSRVLPHVRHLVLGETLRWGDLPPLYNNGTFGSLFSNVGMIELSCQFGSVEDVYRAVRSFKNVKAIRLSYDRHVLPQWAVDQTPIDDFGRNPSFRGAFKIQDLELPVELLHPVLNVFGDSVVNLSVRCPRMSTIPGPNTSQRHKRHILERTRLPSLQAVKMHVPAEGNGIIHSSDIEGAGLDKLQDLVACITPITKPTVRYSLFVARCHDHNDARYCVEDISADKLWGLIGTASGIRESMWWHEVVSCRCSAASGDHWRCQLKNYLHRNSLQAYVVWGHPQQTGPKGAPTWTISIFFNQVEYGRGSSITENIAREIAAEQALRVLWSQRGA